MERRAKTGRWIGLGGGPNAANLSLSSASVVSVDEEEPEDAESDLGLDGVEVGGGAAGNLLGRGSSLDCRCE